MYVVSKRYSGGGGRFGMLLPEHTRIRVGDRVDVFHHDVCSSVPIVPINGRLVNGCVSYIPTATIISNIRKYACTAYEIRIA